MADLDLKSRDPQDFIWRSYLKKGRVVRLSSRPQRDRFTVVWDEEALEVSYSAYKSYATSCTCSLSRGLIACSFHRDHPYADST